MLITFVAKVINLFAISIQKIILFASIIGELIISSLIWIVTTMLDAYYSIRAFFHIVYEDNASLFTELPDSTKEFGETILNQAVFVQNGIGSVLGSLHNKVHDVLSSTLHVINAVLLVVSEVLLLFTNTIIFMGETTWLIVTFIPLRLPQLTKATAKFILDIISWYIVDGYMRLLKFTNYLTEVPLESFMGIVSAIIIVRLCTHFKEIIISTIFNLYWSLVRNMYYCYYALYNYFTNSDVHLITSMASGDALSVTESTTSPNEVDETNSAADALCVICQERQKKVLTLPCRHICLCTECCRRLYGYQRTCPICRTFIYHSVTVYW